jgi:hypothetical protein
MDHIGSQEHFSSEEETFRKAFFDIAEMVKVLFDERNERLQGESSNPPKDDGDHEKNSKREWREWWHSTSFTLIFFFLYYFRTNTYFSKGEW